MVALAAIPSHARLLNQHRSVDCTSRRIRRRGNANNANITNKGLGSKPTNVNAQDLYRLVCALSHACESDCNVLRDGQLVDQLEQYAKHIARVRKETGQQQLSQVQQQQSKRVDNNKREITSQYVEPRFTSTTHTSNTMPSEKPKLTGVKSRNIKQQQQSIQKVSHSGLLPLSPSIVCVDVVQKPLILSPNTYTAKKERIVSSPSKLQHQEDLAASIGSTDSSMLSSNGEDMTDRADMSTCVMEAVCVENKKTVPYTDDLFSNESTIVCEEDSTMHVEDVGNVTNVPYSRHSDNNVDTDNLHSQGNESDNELSDSIYIRRHSTSMDQDFSLLDTLQSQIDLLLVENGRILSENDRLKELIQMTACDAEEQAAQKLQVAALLILQSDRMLEIERKLRETKERSEIQESCRGMAENEFQAVLDAKMQTISSLQLELQSKDEEIARLSHSANDRTISVQESTLFKDNEMKRMRTALMEKDREICHLYMHLSTKKKLMEEITKTVVHHMEIVNYNHGDVVNVDLDVFLFKNVVEKQQKVDELTAAVGVMEREVETLEARIATKVRENNQLRENHEALARKWQTVNAQVCRIQVENEHLNASIKEKERQILHLDDQVNLRQTQLEALLREKDSNPSVVARSQSQLSSRKSKLRLPVATSKSRPHTSLNSLSSERPMRTSSVVRIDRSLESDASPSSALEKQDSIDFGSCVRDSEFAMHESTKSATALTNGDTFPYHSTTESIFTDCLAQNDSFDVTFSNSASAIYSSEDDPSQLLV